jgi:hypothetical protein
MGLSSVGGRAILAASRGGGQSARTARHRDPALLRDVG